MCVLFGSNPICVVNLTSCWRLTTKGKQSGLHQPFLDFFPMYKYSLFFKKCQSKKNHIALSWSGAGGGSIL